MGNFRLTDRKVVITGATGILGSWLVAEALERGVQPIALLRDRDVARARARLEAVLRVTGHELLAQRVEILVGDARLPNFGLPSTIVDRLRGSVSSLIHCAASTSFNPRDDAEVWTSNVRGTAHALDFAERIRSSLHYVSTAFVAGKRSGLVTEQELETGHTFNNMYERSKCVAERLVRDALRAGRIRGAIFRPSIIVGSVEHGRISDFQNFYRILRLVDRASTLRVTGCRRLRVAGNPASPLNLVPVDWTARALWTIIEREGLSGLTYHLTNPAPNTIAEVRDWVNATIAPAPLELSITPTLDVPLTTLEAKAHAAFEQYRPYLMSQPDFDGTNTRRALNGLLPFPPLDHAGYSAMLTYARSQAWKGALASFTKGHAPLPEVVGRR